MGRNADQWGKNEEKAGGTSKSNQGDHGEPGAFSQGSDDSDYNDRPMDDEIDYEDLEDMWYEIEKEYRVRYPKLTDGDVTVEPGRFDRTIDRIGRRIEKSPHEVRNDIENWR